LSPHPLQPPPGPGSGRSRKAARALRMTDASFGLFLNLS
jgi:hypothetical protein